MGSVYCHGEHFSKKFSFNRYSLGYNVRPNQVILIASILSWSSKVCKVFKLDKDHDLMFPQK